MGRSSLAPVLHFLQTHLGRSNGGAGSDEHLLERFAFQCDAAAFEALVERHGPLVWGVCSRVLRREQDIEDAFQATFLVLVRKARSIRRRASVTSWLHGVAHRIALQARARSQRDFTHELKESTRTESDAATGASFREVRAILDEEILSLPERFRTPLLLCCFGGRTKAEAARELGWKEGTVASRLARARQRLHGRLARRGVGLAAGSMGFVVAEKSLAAVPVAVAAATVRLAILIAAGETASVGGVSTPVGLLANGILNGMAVTKLKLTVALIATMCLLGAGAGWAAHQVLEKETPHDQTKEEPPPGKKADTPKADEAKQAKKDYYGDPLPPGVLARMGTVQLRHRNAAVRFFDDGKTLMSGGVDGVIDSWDVTTGKLLDQKLLDKIDRSGQGLIVGGHTFSGDGKTLLAFRNKDLQVFDVATGKELCSDAPCKSGFSRAALSFDGKLAAGQADELKNRPVYLWEAGTGKKLQVLEYTRNEFANQLAFSPDGKLLGVVCNHDVRLWDTETGTERLKLKIDSNALAFSADAKLLATGHARGVVTIWDTATGTKQAKLTSSIETYVQQVAFSPDGKTLAAGGQQALTLWDVPAQKELYQLSSAFLGWLAFSPDGKTLASSGLSSIHLWNVATGKALYAREGHISSLKAVAVSPDGAMIASLEQIGNTLRLWNSATGKPSHVFSEINWNIRECAFSADGQWLICAKDDGSVRFWDVSTGKEVRKYAVENPDKDRAKSQLLHIRLSTDGKRLIALGFNKLTVWDVKTGKEIATRGIEEGAEYAISPDGNDVALLSAGRQGIQDSVVIQDAVTGKVRATAHGEFGYFMRMSPDGKTLAVVSPPSVFKSFRQPEVPLAKQAHGVTFIQVADGKTTFHIKTPALGQLAFSRDGRILATAHADALRIWEIATGQELFHIKRPENFHDAQGDSFVTFLAFMPNGKALVTGMADSTVLVWDLTPDGWSRKELDPKALATLWPELDGDAPQAYRALWSLGESPAQVVPFLKERLKPAEEVDPKHVQRLLANLDSDQFTTRDKAAKELATLRERIEPALRKALEGEPSEEMRKQVKALLDGPIIVPSGETLRTLRAIQVLEQIGTNEACAVLKKLAGGAEGARETREAKEALERLSGRVGLDR